MSAPDFLPVSAVARILGRDVRTVHRMIERGELQATKAHNGLRAPYIIARADVDALLAKNTAA